MTQYYASIVSTLTPTKTGKLNDDEDTSTKQAEGGSHKKHKGTKKEGKTPKKSKEDGHEPRLIKEDYQKLTSDEWKELQSTGKVSAYMIILSSDKEGKHKLVKKEVQEMEQRLPRLVTSLLR